ncbi:thyroid receptor-interacting protein 11-like [Megalobrama amblycephala]|uniref:thyroid receptor-interacting protein 11-like n=1 Tax=Megalobrama amblycephala TaxID=75352 RepID=UPI0020140CF5|nr:thyroid receptor-interacting protein 11-like [Megalobrama amblycephala]XP_048030843.1 thyroid receptor-interacting protein 11-like [Megalobrama amblycephala]XP_048030844.1 thyroid receptor-interacting protein 11-like [Megalobrama amblycephala]
MTLCENVTCFTCERKRLLKLCLMLILISIFVIIVLISVKHNQLDDHQRDAAELDSRWLQQCTLSKNTTDGKEFVSSDSTSCPEFIKELLPSAERTALLYHLSYLCLGNFPEMERLIRKRAVETQLLFGSSKALLLKCEGTSDNFVKLLLPSLKVAAEKNKPELALKFLEKAKEWISYIVMAVKEIVKRYEKHNSDVCDLTSDMVTVKVEKKQQQQTSEMKALQKIIDGLEEKLLHISKKIDDYEKKIEEKNSDIHTMISSITETDLNIYSMIVPFVESNIFKTMRFSPEKDQLRALYADLSEITEPQKSLKEEEWDIQNQLLENQLKLAKLQFENGQLSSIRSLYEVQMHLSQIQNILVRLQKFWEKVGNLLDTLKESTLAGDIWIEELEDLKEQFLESIDAAKEEWTKFGISCMTAYHIFSIQTNDAYRFLEISPSSLSKEEWQKEYESMKEKLQNIKPKAVCPTPQ